MNPVYEIPPVTIEDGGEKCLKNQTTTSYDIDSKIKSKMSNIMNWVGFYREHIDVFIEDYLEIKVKLFQKNNFDYDGL